MLWYMQRSEDNFISQFSPSTRWVLGVEFIGCSCKCLYSLSPPSISFCVAWGLGCSKASLITPENAVGLWQKLRRPHSVPSLMVTITLTSEHHSQQSSAEFFAPPGKQTSCQFSTSHPVAKCRRGMIEKSVSESENTQITILLGANSIKCGTTVCQAW